MAPLGEPLTPGRGRGIFRSAFPPEAASVRGEPVIVAVTADGWPRFEPRAPVVGCLVEGAGLPPRPAGVAAVGDVDPDLLREGETVTVDGDRGRFEIEGVQEVEVVTAFLRREDGRVLLLQRSERVRTFRGRWAGVSGYVEELPPIEQARREISEEVGLGEEALTWRASGRRVLARSESTIFVVHPFLFDTSRATLRLDWEHVAAEWVEPAEISRRATVPKLARAWEAVAAPDARGKS